MKALPLCVALMFGAVTAQDPENTSGAPVPELPEFPEDPADRGQAIATYADRHDSGWKDSYAKSKMTLYDAGGDSVARSSVQLILEGTDGDKSIIRFITPPEIKNVAALTHERPAAVDDSWLYLPASKRVRRISGANKTASFQGTEFTYEDLSNLVIRKYDWRLLGEVEIDAGDGESTCYKLEAKPRYSDTGYSRLVVYINRESWRRERVDFYDKAGRLLKVLSGSKWRLLHGRFWRPYQVEMQNKQTNKRTVIEVEQQLLNLGLYKSRRTGKARKNLTDAQFTTRALERR